MRPGRTARAASTTSASRATPANWRGSAMRSRLTEAGKAEKPTTDYADSRRLDLQSKALTTKDTKSTKKSEQENGEFGFAFTFVSFVLFVATNGLIIEQTLSFRLSVIVVRRRCAGVVGLHQASGTQSQTLTVKPLRELRTRLPAALRSFDITLLCLQSRALPANASVALSVCSIVRPLVSAFRFSLKPLRRPSHRLKRPPPTRRRPTPLPKWSRRTRR